MGCLPCILLILMYYGHFVLITGEVIHEPVNWIFAIPALLLDALFIWSSVSDAERKRQQEAAAEAERWRRAQEEEAKKTRKQIHDLITNYSLKKFCVFQSQTATTQADPHTSSMVYECYKDYWEAFTHINDQILELYESSKQILKCSECISDDHKLRFLLRNEGILIQNKHRAQQLAQKRDQIKINITETESDSLQQLKNAMILLRNSQKCVSSSYLTINGFTANKRTADLDCFQCSINPVMLHFGEEVSAACFPRFILIFHKEKFLTAVKPSALVIEVTRVVINATYDLDRKKYIDNRYIDEDSEIIQKGQEKTQLSHTYNDGSSGSRYPNNSVKRYRKDIVAYGQVKIRIGDIGKHLVEFTFSSQEAVKALRAANTLYCLNAATARDPIPLLLDLLEATTGDAELICEMRNTQKENCEVEVPVCKIIGTDQIV